MCGQLAHKQDEELCVICGNPVCVNESDEPVCQECLDNLGLI